MEENKHSMGMDTTFKDKNGAAIKVHSYVKDGDGRLYFINSHLQAVPDGVDAPATELKKLAETTELTAMTAAEVLEHRESVHTVQRKRGRARKAAAEPEKPVKEEAKADDSQKKAFPEEDELFPVSMQLVLTAIPDNALAAELRRRGYTLCAVKPALLTV